MTEERIWYLWTGEGQKGPYTPEELHAWKQSGHITDEWHVWREGFSGWKKLGETPELFLPVIEAPVAHLSFQTAPEEKPQSKPAVKRSLDYKQIAISLCVIVFVAVLFSFALNKFRYDRKQAKIKAEQERKEPLLKYIDKMPSISNQYLKEEPTHKNSPDSNSRLYEQLQKQVPPQTELKTQD